VIQSQKCSFLFGEAWGSVVVKALCLIVRRSRDRSPVVSLGIFSVVPSDKTTCPEVDPASENEYQGFLLVYRRPVCLADDLPPL
jgi:hypothetical protein